MRNVPAALQTHLDGEVISLARCIKITLSDGRILRLTTHDVDIVVSGDTYVAGIPLEFSSFQSSSDLSVDNAELVIGIDEDLIKTVDLDGGAYDAAPFELFALNWETPANGVVYLKRGTLGDVTVEDGISAKVHLRGLTQALQRPIVERYSPTCRAALGSTRCGYANLPNKVRRNNQKVKTFDWFVIPAANITTPSIANLSFESATISPDWTIPAGSTWNRANAFSAFDGTYYAEGGAASTNAEIVMYKDLDTATIGMSNANVDTGNFSFDFACQMAATSNVYENSGKLFIEQFDSTGRTLRRDETEAIFPEYQSWNGHGITAFIVPTCRTIRIGLINIVDSGAAGYVAFDACTARFWTNETSTFTSKVFRTVKIPYRDTGELYANTNTSFETDGDVGNTNAASAITGWTIPTSASYWRVLGTSGGLGSYHQSKYLLGGDDGSTTPNRIYEIYQQVSLVNGGTLAAAATAANITAGWYYAELNLRVAKTDSDSAPRAVLGFYNGAGSLISEKDSGYLTSLTEDTWTELVLSARVPSGTASIRISLFARSGAGGSVANAAFDGISLYFVPTAYEHTNDPETGNLAATLPAYSYTTDEYTVDGDAVVQAKSASFGYTTVTAVTSTRVFEATGISDTAELLYSGKIVWLSGNNAGKTSFIRVWDNTTKIVKLYDALPATIQVGDKFVFSRGCDKTIDRCADTFGNAHNFRGEPYLPGPAKVIEFLTSA